MNYTSNAHACNSLYCGTKCSVSSVSSVLPRRWLAAIFHLFRTCSPLGPWGGQVRLWPIPPTRVTNSLRFFPPAGGCGPSGPKPHATKPASSRLQLALLTRPGTPTWPGLLSHPHTLSLCYINTHYIAHCSSTLHSCFDFCTLLSTLLFIVYIFVSYILCFLVLMCSTFLTCSTYLCFYVFMLCVVLIVFVCFYVMCSTYCVCMFLCLLYAPSHQKKFQVGVNLLGNQSHSDSDSDSDSDTQGQILFLNDGWI